MVGVVGWRISAVALVELRSCLGGENGAGIWEGMLSVCGGSPLYEVVVWGWGSKLSGLEASQIWREDDGCPEQVEVGANSQPARGGDEKP